MFFRVHSSNAKVSCHGGRRDHFSQSRTHAKMQTSDYCFELSTENVADSPFHFDRQYAKQYLNSIKTKNYLTIVRILFCCCLNFFVNFFSTVLNTVLKIPEILSCIMFPLSPLHVNIFLILFALLFVRGVANDCLNFYMRKFAKVVSVLQQRQKLPGTGFGRSDFIAH